MQTEKPSVTGSETQPILFWKQVNKAIKIFFYFSDFKITVANSHFLVIGRST